MLLVGGCSFRDTPVFFSTGTGANNAFAIGERKCSKKEALLYVASYSDYYSNIGGTEIDLNDEIYLPTKDRLKNNAYLLLTRVYSLDLYGDNNKIELDDTDNEIIKNATDEFLKNLSKEDIRILEITDADVKKAYENYVLAIKVYKSLMEGVDENVTEDEARVMEGYVIKTSDSEKASEIEKRIRRGDSFATLTQVYSEESKRVISFGRNHFLAQVDEAAFSLEDGEISEKIETDDGYYFVQCINKYDVEKSEQNKDVIIMERQKSLLDRIVAEQNENNYSEVDENFFDSISIDNLQLSVGNSFFSTIEKYL